jgi:hypothetical protein
MTMFTNLNLAREGTTEFSALPQSISKADFHVLGSTEIDKVAGRAIP